MEVEVVEGVVVVEGGVMERVMVMVVLVVVLVVVVK